MNLNFISGFRVGQNRVVISHLQYFEDTLCIGEAMMENHWTLKALLRGFKIVSWLKVNFRKVYLMRVNMPKEFMEMACDFLNCSEGSFPFKYYGLMIGKIEENFLLRNLFCHKLIGD